MKADSQHEAIWKPNARAASDALHVIVVLHFAAALLAACAHAREPETTVDPAPVAPQPSPEPEVLRPLTDDELRACHDELSSVHRRLDAGDLSAGAVVSGRTHANDDVTRLCAARTEAPTCFLDDGSSAYALVVCLDRHYCAQLRNHGVRVGLSGMRGADDPSKLHFLRQMMREAHVTECALLRDLERRVAP